ncbi:CDP-alcohol phosphatidyltransferase family protein [bacterium]|nr:CDP-alcohol phosphatidyltransferase family protein [bacterium]
MDIYALRKKGDRILRKVVRVFLVVGIGPDFLTICSLLFAGIAAFFFWFSGKELYPWLEFAFLFLLVSSLLDALDGPLAREMKIASKKGDFLDHAFDRYADTLLIGGIVLGNWAKYEIVGFLAISGVLLTSYFGVQAQALGLSREYRGILGRAYRLSILIILTFLNIVFPGEIGIGVAKFSFLGWAMLIFGILGIFTAIQRTFYIWRALSKSR